MEFGSFQPMPSSWLRYWGKAQAKSESTEVPDHSLVFHSLDVAACGRTFLIRRPALLRQLAQWLGQSEAATLSLVTFLLAVHDIGKFGENFQGKAPEIVHLRFGDGFRFSPSRMRHDEVSSCFLSWMIVEDRLSEPWRGWRLDDWSQALLASFGHHGTPVPSRLPREASARLTEAMSAESRQIAADYFHWCAEAFLLPGYSPCDPASLRLASWWLAGIAVLADWLGSNTEWFEYAEKGVRDRGVEAYWQEIALKKAAQALDESGVIPIAMRSFAEPEALLRSLSGKVLRPAQLLASTVVIRDEPQIFFLEDATGSGKTEAALILATRLIDAGRGSGFYFGLPSQATADQMYERVDLALSAWFDDPSRASLVLSHSARDQVHSYSAKLRRLLDDVPGEPDTATARVTQWLAESNKRALLAQIGVGTLDQAILSVLRVKHQSLRVLGLFDKVLLVDEVHSYDPYLTRALCEMLRLHAASGGSAILLSATMSLALRTELLDAFARGVETSRPRPRTRQREPLRVGVEARSLEYPLLTRWMPSCGRHPEEIAFPPSPNSRRDLAIDYLSDTSEVHRRIESWLARNRCVVWIRNTVADARATYDELVRRFGADRITLFHSRFALVDRLRIQGRVLQMLGKSSDAAARAGRIVIATQVLQESLDVDADYLISDLCPVDVLLQRFGRYRRHRRDVFGNPVGSTDAPDGREPEPIVVFGPDRDGEPDRSWYRKFSVGAAEVYSAHGRLFLGARAIDRGVGLPCGYRALIEGVYGADDEQIPATLLDAEDKVRGDEIAQRWAAEGNAIALEKGYQGDSWDSNERISSRLGDSVEGTLIRGDGDDVLPWAEGCRAPGDDAWALSALRLPGRWLRGLKDDIATWPEPRLRARLEALLRRPQLKYRVLLLATKIGEGDWEVRPVNSDDHRFRYDECAGLRRDSS